MTIYHLNYDIFILICVLILEEAARVVSPRGRIVVSSATENTPSMLEETGLKILVAEAETVVAVLG